MTAGAQTLFHVLLPVTLITAAPQARSADEGGVPPVGIASGRRLVPCSGIYVVRSRPWRQVHDEQAAHQLKRYIHEATSQDLPVIYLEDGRDIEPGMFLVGEAAHRAIPERMLGALGPGGFVIHVENGVAAVAGKAPSGVTVGTFRFIEKLLGVTFVTGQSLLRFETEPEIAKRDAVRIEEMSFTRSPHFELRYAMHGIALGYTDVLCWGDERHIGQPGRHRWHVMGSLLDFGRYGESHPEYFSRDRNGKVLSVPLDGVHACLSNPEGAGVVKEAFLKWVRGAPSGIHYPLLQGDGRGLSCQCPDCQAMVKRDGSYTDSWLRFVNGVAAAVEKEFPHKKVCTVAYVDTEKPPLRVRPAANVLVFYAIYPPSWSNHLQAFDETRNKAGMEALAGWIKASPDRLYVEEYPISYAERLNIWPSLYATVDRIRFYAKHSGIKGVELCGFMPGWNCFSQMQRYVISRVLWDPATDVEEQIDTFMALYYGPAAPHMREFFDLVHKEVRDRGLAMRCEGALRGLVTEKVAERSYAAFGKAQDATAGNQRYFDRVEFEKLFLLCTDLTDRCLANGKIGREDLPGYARRLAEFAELAGRRWQRDDFARRVPASTWFRQTAFLEIAGPVWYEDPALKSLVRQPLETVRALYRQNCEGK